MTDNPIHRALAIQLIAFTKTVSDSVRDGIQVTDLYGLWRAFQEYGPALTSLQAMSNDERAGVFGELFDALTGQDDTALVVEFIPGLDGADEEAALDLVKKILVAKIQQAV